MQTVLTCLTTQHDWRLVVLAACVCLIGMITMLRMFSRVSKVSSNERPALLAAAGSIGGAAVWSTHFIGMLAYTPAIPVAYALWPTLASFAVVMAGMTLGLATAAIGGRLALGLGAGVLAAATAAMHFIGMDALRMNGAMVWDSSLVLASLGIGVALFAGAMILVSRGAWRLTLAAGVVATLAVCALHFIAMAAATIVPDPSLAVDPLGLSGSRIAIGVAIATALTVAASGVVGLLGLWSRRSMLNQLREAIDAMPDGLGFYDSEDRLIIWNARYAEVNAQAAPVLTPGRTFREILEFELDQGHYPEALGRRDAWIEDRMAARARLSATLEQQTSDGRWLRVQDRRTSDGGVVTLVNDITDLKDDALALTLARDEAEAANRAKSEFLANMSHEIRTPLNGVIGVAQALEQTPLNADQTEMLDLIRSSGETLQRLLSDILDLARVESGHINLRAEPFDLQRAVTESAQLYAASAAEKGLQFFVEMEPSSQVWVEGDVTRLKQILTNLVSNAVKFTTRGFVKLTVARRHGEFSAFRFTVEDTGVGFDGAARDRLFTRFEQADGTITRRFGGTGLGLAICRQLAEMMQGDLDCESEPNGGSAFILTLPLPETRQPEAAPIAETAAETALGPDAASDAEPRRALRVLLADDHPTNRKVVELILAQADVNLLSVENGAQAVEACRAEDFDVILMDMQMPVMDGLTATREIRLHEAAMGQAATPILMLTANALPEHIESARAAGADRHLAKPFNAMDLISALTELAEAHATALAA